MRLEAVRCVTTAPPVIKHAHHAMCRERDTGMRVMVAGAAVGSWQALPGTAGRDLQRSGGMRQLRSARTVAVFPATGSRAHTADTYVHTFLYSQGEGLFPGRGKKVGRPGSRNGIDPLS